MIRANHLTKRYSKKLAVNDLSFEVKPGKVTGFLGPNGAGKSTTMRLMLGLDNGQGATTFDGKALSECKQPSRVVGVLLEAKAFHPSRTARTHLKILAVQGGIPVKRVDEVLDIVGLSDVAKKGPAKFSLGMSQRLGIAAALLGEPKYLILDEPANGLDPEGIAWLRNFLKNYADNGNGVFVSSHLLSEMALMADDVVVIGKGSLITNTSVKALTENRSHSSVFIRASNVSKLQKILSAQSIAFHKEGKGLRVEKVQTDEIGKLAFAAGVTVLELTPQQASLEEVFLELTAGSEEYQAKESNHVKEH